MNRTHITALVSAGAIALSAAVAPTAVAGSHWSQAKCNKTYLSWSKRHTGSNGSVSPKQAKEQTAYIKKLEHQHRCHFAG
ncbi:MAG TPA: hypothetical protein VID48_00310 [Solirubrobacteraceae bacterium]|jgi:hypothetical protein